MAAINELIDQIENVELRNRILTEVNKLSKQRKFGLVYEEHIPEATMLYDVPIRKGTKVALRSGKIKDCYRVLSIKGNDVLCEKMDDSHARETFPKNDLVAVAHFGEPIYPYLQYKDSICNAPDSDLWHTLIEADNYHALQLLVYLYGGKVDCIYIDPPYNTGARDWKYNNDYVDSSDSYRHSKWLSMMEKRLRLAKKLLNPNESVLIVTIDEKEYLHLGCLLEQLFPEARTQMVSCCINPAGVARANEFARSDEYIFFVKLGNSGPTAIPLSSEWIGSVKNTSKNKVLWASLLRTGTNNMRNDRPNLFYPLFVSKDGKQFVGAGNPLPLSVDRNSINVPEGTKAIFPIHLDGSEGCWQIGKDTLIELQKNHFVRLGGFTDRGMGVSYLKSGEQNKVHKGIYKIRGIKEDGSYDLDDSNYTAAFVPWTQWMIPAHDASRNGSGLLRRIFLEKRFDFPKSLYAVADSLRFFVAKNPDALILDFFAGSGTTLHAVNLLNAEDGGHRRCIMVTNNEVSDEESKNLIAQGYKQGDKGWEKYGIANYITWPRTKCSILGKDINGNSIKGNYLGSDTPMADGFKANATFYKLGFLDKTAVSIGRQLKELIPLLWMKAGAINQCPEINGDEDMVILPKNKFALLVNECAFSQFEAEMRKHPEIEVVYIITNSEAGYREMITNLKVKQTYQLYRDYLDNFRINYSK